MGALFLIVGSILTISRYGWIYLFAYIPIWFVFGHFLGIAPLIGTLRIARHFSARDLMMTLVAQVVWVAILVLLINVLGIGSLFVFIIASALNCGFRMDKDSLIGERQEWVSRKTIRTQ